MWGDSWINLMMKMKDMPHYHYKKSKSTDDKNAPEAGAKRGTIADLQKRFPKQQL